MLSRPAGAVCAAAMIALLASAPADAVVIGDPDRQTIAEHATSVGQPMDFIERRFAASGTVYCEAPDGSIWHASSFSLVGRSDVVAFSAHALVDPITCRRKHEPSDCRFTVNPAVSSVSGGSHDSGEYYSAALLDVVAMGFACEGSDRQSSSERLFNDWAVGRLDRSLPVVPYEIDAFLELEPGRPVISVPGAGGRDAVTDDSVRADPSFREFPKTIGTCTLLTIGRDGAAPWFKTDCDLGHRSSGGAILDDSGHAPILLGINTYIARELSIDELNAGEVLTCRFDGFNCYARHIPLSGAFLDAILSQLGF